MKILKKNQVIISVIALILITVGYMSYTSNVAESVGDVAGIGDAKLVNSGNIAQNEEDDDYEDEDKDKDDGENENRVEIDGISEAPGMVQTESSTSTENLENNSVQTSALRYNDEYFTTSKLERDKMYSQMLETYQGLLKNETTPVEQKNSSSQEITNINNQKNSIMIAENLIKNLGFEDVVIFINNGSVSVVVKAEKLEEADVAQIQNIVCREIGVEADKIHVSVK